MSSGIGSPRLSIKTRCLIVFAIIAFLFVGGFTWWKQVLIPHLRGEADAHWTAMGRSMAVFTEQLKRVEENESLRALIRDLKPFGVESLYRTDVGEKDPNNINIPAETLHFVTPHLAMDEVSTKTQGATYLIEHIKDLDRLYTGILQRNPPVWSCVPEDGYAMRPPNFLVASQISKLIYADAIYKIEKGDEEGATRALTAGLRMTVNLGEQPILISQMIRTAIEALFAPAIARLPLSSEMLNQVDSDVRLRRERWRKAVQCETWALTDLVDHIDLGPYRARKKSNPSIFEKSMISFAQCTMQVDLSRFIVVAADDVKASQWANDLAISDLGLAEMRRTATAYAPLFTDRLSLTSVAEGWPRSWMRANAILLVREQADVIRSTRARLQAGESGDLGERSSIVIPGAKWHITVDATTNSGRFQLIPVPSWTTEDCNNQNPYLLPLDGSKSWKFRTIPTNSSETIFANR